MPYNKNNLAAFVSVDSDATDPETYGRIRVLAAAQREHARARATSPTRCSPTPTSREALQPLTLGGSSRVTYGNLLTLPVTGGLMYVQPIYATRQLSDASYPILRYVIVSYGDEVGIGDDAGRGDHRRARRRRAAAAARTAARTTRRDDGGGNSPDAGPQPRSRRPRTTSRQPTARSPKARSASGPR